MTVKLILLLLRFPKGKARKKGEIRNKVALEMISFTEKGNVITKIMRLIYMLFQQKFSFN